MTRRIRMRERGHLHRNNYLADRDRLTPSITLINFRLFECIAHLTWYRVSIPGVIRRGSAILITLTTREMGPISILIRADINNSRRKSIYERRRPRRVFRGCKEAGITFPGMKNGVIHSRSMGARGRRAYLPSSPSADDRSDLYIPRLYLPGSFPFLI